MPICKVKLIFIAVIVSIAGLIAVPEVQAQSVSVGLSGSGAIELLPVSFLD